jgi:hypothetical protein
LSIKVIMNRYIYTSRETSTVDTVDAVDAIDVVDAIDEFGKLGSINQTNQTNQTNQIDTSDPIYNSDESNDSDDSSDLMANDDLCFEILDTKNNSNQPIQIYTIPKRGFFHNEKRLLCFSVINGQNCIYRNKCTYAHNLEEQIIDIDRKFVYQIILDNSLMEFFSITNPKTDEIYKSLLLMTQVCDTCYESKCTGGYNCKYGVFDTSLKLCKNDIMMGECVNNIHAIAIDPIIFLKIDGITQPTQYQGCVNGHHLTSRGFIPYYKFINMKETSKKNYYKSTRYIDIDASLKIFRDDSNENNCIRYKFTNEESSSEEDEELSELFRKNRHIDLGDSIKDNKDDTDVVTRTN